MNGYFKELSNSMRLISYAFSAALQTAINHEEVKKMLDTSTKEMEAAFIKIYSRVDLTQITKSLSLAIDNLSSQTDGSQTISNQEKVIEATESIINNAVADESEKKSIYSASNLDSLKTPKPWTRSQKIQLVSVLASIILPILTIILNNSNKGDTYNNYEISINVDNDNRINEIEDSKKTIEKYIYDILSSLSAETSDSVNSEKDLEQDSEIDLEIVEPEFKNESDTK